MSWHVRVVRIRLASLGCHVEGLRVVAGTPAVEQGEAAKSGRKERVAPDDLLIGVDRLVYGRRSASGSFGLSRR